MPVPPYRDPATQHRQLLRHDCCRNGNVHHEIVTLLYRRQREELDSPVYLARQRFTCWSSRRLTGYFPCTHSCTLWQPVPRSSVLGQPPRFLEQAGSLIQERNNCLAMRVTDGTISSWERSFLSPQKVFQSRLTVPKDTVWHSQPCGLWDTGAENRLW